MLLVVAALLRATANNLSIAHDSEELARLSRVFDSYMSDHPAGTGNWWYKTTVSPEIALKSLGDDLTKNQNLVADAVQKFGSTNQATKEIASAFPAFRTSVYNNGTAVSIGNSTKAITPVEGQQEVCFFAQSDMKGGELPSSLFWNPDWKTLMICGVTYPPKLFPALVLHELGHGLAQRQKRPSSTARPDSDLYIEEEIEIHGIEAAVMDRATNGAYYQMLDEILARAKPTTWHKAVYAISSADLVRLDRLFGAEKSDKVVAQTLIAQFVISLGLRYVDASIPVSERPAMKLELYRQLTATFS
jgi:hypothetical protein